MKNPKFKKLNIQTRDENIAIAERRGHEVIEVPKDQIKKTLKKDEIKQQLKPVRKKPRKPKDKRPFIVLKPQEKFLAEKNNELVEELHKSYLAESRFGDGLKHAGGKKRDSLKFGHVRSCPREVYYDFFEPERARAYTAKGLILFEEGKRHHKNIQGRLEDRRVLQGTEGYLHIEEINANGFYDGLIPVKNEDGSLLYDGEWQICDLFELKSKLPYAAEAIGQGDHDQAQLYHYGAKSCPRLKAKKIRVRNIRLMNRDRAIQTDEVDFSWMIKPDLDRQAEIMEFMRYLWNKIFKEKHLPPHPHERKEKPCIWCRYNEHCWRKHPMVIKEAPVSDEIEAVEIPNQEILESYAKRIYSILDERKKLAEELKALELVVIAYFTKNEAKTLRVNESEVLAPKQSTLTDWNYAKLREAIGDKYYSLVSMPNARLVNHLIKTEFVDAGKFEEFKEYKKGKMSLYIKKLREE